MHLLIEMTIIYNKCISDCSALCEIAGVFVGLLLILYTENKWLYSGLFNVIGAWVACLVWLVPMKST